LVEVFMLVTIKTFTFRVWRPLIPQISIDVQEKPTAYISSGHNRAADSSKSSVFT